MDSQKKPNKLKTILEFISGLLTLLKWVPFLGKWRAVIVALSTVVGVLTGLANRCDVQSTQPVPKEAPSAPTATPVHTPSPSPTPTPKPLPKIIIDGIVQVGKPFTVKYTGEFEYNTSIYADEFYLQLLGREHGTGYMVASAVVLNTAGSRKITIRDSSGEVLASSTIEVTP